MYHDFYQLHSLPFENTPDPRFFYASEQHREALAAIEYTIRMRKGFVLITGDIGSGKTTVGQTMLDRCADQAMILPLLHGHTDGDGLLRQALRTLQVTPKKTDDHGQLLERLRERLLQQLDQARPVVMLVDEAQTLSDQALEELRLLSNFDTRTDKLLQIILIGQPELRSRLRAPNMAALRQRIVLAKQLRPLNLQETIGYVAHRIRAASIDPQKPGVQFADSACEELFRFTGGIPRLINVACDNCLLLGFVREAREITPAMVKRGLEDMVPNLCQEQTGPLAVIHPSSNTLSLTGSM